MYKYIHTYTYIKRVILFAPWTPEQKPASPWTVGAKSKSYLYITYLHMYVYVYIKAKAGEHVDSRGQK
jgi:hypothetical protein